MELLVLCNTSGSKDDSAEAYHADEWVLPRVEGFWITLRWFRPDTSSAGHDFVKDEKCAVFVAYSSHGLEVAGRWRNTAQRST